MTAHANYPSLRERAVLVTGGGSGIGAAIVSNFCAQGARVAFIDIAREASEQLVADVGAAGDPPPKFIESNLTDIESLRAAVRETIDALGPIHVLVNNAAHDERHALETVTPEYWDARMAVNLRHQFFAAQAVAPGMTEAGGGAIINLGSTTWIAGQGGMAGYSAAKSGVVGLTRSLARDLGPAGIRVNSILPGWIMTERQQRLWLTPESEAELMQRQCIKRKLYPDDIARVVLFFAADDSSACTAQNYIVDGGWV